MEKHKATFIAPIGIGLSLFIGELVAVYYTGGSLNPARSFGPSAVTHTFSRNDWIYWVGPLMGSIFAVAFYWFIKVLEYELANPGQDADEKMNDPPRTPNNHRMPHVVEERAVESGSRGTESIASIDLGQRIHPMSGINEDIESPQASPTGLLAKLKSRTAM